MTTGLFMTAGLFNMYGHDNAYLKDMCTPEFNEFSSMIVNSYRPFFPKWVDQDRLSLVIKLIILEKLQTAKKEKRNYINVSRFIAQMHMKNYSTDLSKVDMSKYNNYIPQKLMDII